MSDTARPAALSAEEPKVMSAEDRVAAAAEAFRVSAAARDEEGNEIPDRGGDDEEGGLDPRVRRGDEVAGEGSGIPDHVRDDDEGGDDDAESATTEAGSEPQPDAVAMPSSWGREDAELWSSLPAAAQAKIAVREGQRDRAVNLKFQEAANVLKANQALIAEAQATRARYADAAETVLGLVVPQPPPRSMLDKESPDYDPDRYHLRKAQHEDTLGLLAQHRLQLGQARAQEQLQRVQAINHVTRDAFVASVPEIADPARAPAILRELIDYAATLGAPAEAFAGPTTALEWHVLWKAREHDRLQAAKARIDKDPKPEPRKAQPAVRPGVAAPRGAAEQQRRGAALDRLRKEGSVDAGAAAIKQLMKGSLS